MVAELRYRNSPAGSYDIGKLRPVSGCCPRNNTPEEREPLIKLATTVRIDDEIESTRLKIIAILKENPCNLRTLRATFHRFARLLYRRQFICSFPSERALDAFMTMEKFVARIMPASPG
jgi:hypothetical protein